MHAKEVEGMQLEWGAAWAEGTAACEWEGGGVEHRAVFSQQVSFLTAKSISIVPFHFQNIGSGV